MQRHRHRLRSPRPDRTPSQGWQIGPAPTRAATDPGTRVDLAFPIVIDGETRSSLPMRHPTPKDWAWFRLQRGGDHKNVLRMVARLCSIPTDAIGELDSADLGALLDACATMMGEG